MEEYEYGHEGALQKFLENGRKPQPTYVELLPPASAAEHADLDRRWKLLMLSRRVSGMQDLLESTAGANLAIKEDRLLKRTGAQFTQTIWPVHYLPNITWITEPKHEKMAFS
ncbi:predicted protein [Aspergillus nidulans FGSC A4]|uniref:Uncharacterized protein n=1 Tax=Emericella nidulans (strain FGSC A4 / ATCC 38163 / CBS 112.46 / NRRL 194 / M139) TaxID=227321 RepID=Q5B9I9_EMENI|nr:hypothetical protein [Aspergillus nidulans FGSC A4]EAA63225.1 predicted protein [Aspergillus nidulans FGSC A4]CBF84004.1 TPA: hypothetical protein ANIA_02791 [Aspergillus nidulans FGSC A4]|eukprot:XP_660395.1 predicted protein [Aspergillus nidulans FGSC A4]